jgi:CelD/BcsL family acetyltransferase involved in cellulose biosynthesis
MVKLEVVPITAEPEFLSLENVWNDVARVTRPRSVFLRHEWFASAWAWRRAHAELHILVARRADVTVGILPLIRPTRARSRPSKLELLTVPDTQLADLLCAPENADEVAEAFVATLDGDSSWDTLYLDSLSPDGPGVTSFKTALQRRGLAAAERDGGRNFFIEVWGTWGDYYNSRSRSLKKAMNLAANRLQSTGDVYVESLTPQFPDEARLSPTLETAIAISSRSWKRETGNSLDHPGPQAFIRYLSERAFKRGWLEIWLLQVSGKSLAMEYDLEFEGNIHALRADFDADCTNISPGAHLFRVQLEQLFGRGFTRYYMGRGENAYKLRWTDQGDPLRQLLAYNRTVIGRAVWLRDEIFKPIARKILAALRNNDEEKARKSDKEGNVA